MEGSISGPSEKRVAVVTGGNRGMGLEICRQLAGHGLAVVLTARDDKRGAEAAETLREEGLSDVAFHQLEISEPASAARLAAFVKKKFGKLDILVNNAGVLGVTTDVGDPATLHETLAGKDGMERAEWLRQRTTQTTQDAEDCLRINYHGNKTVTEALLPLLRSSSDGRIVNVTSAWGLLRYFSGDELRRELDDVANLTTQRLDEMSDLFLEDLGKGNGALERRGWPADPVYAAYMASKALVCAYTRVIAREEGAALRVNCVHPGYVLTGMNDYTGVLTAAEGAAAAVAVALAEKGGVTGAYFDRTELGASFV
ncbi:short-chain dehydrogenase/reductase 2b-like [Triticum dicoccoides]|uniref:short-chain dehydrogenase/reductase 2b-like n=1 Tax=Triticum dicoccoides TaxID=85692 RepID=UPI00188FCA42|nr:short-chain dehydrogenase/reductase 2b-like [Triticum dicoccoides]XP_037473580.1 short-chain dehydrogenase/reductase 2b-like [Triticum dicoccoides]